MLRKTGWIVRITILVLQLFNHGTPGYWIGDGSLDLVLLRSFSNYKDYQILGIKKCIPGYELSTQTELANEHGSHYYRYSLYPHKGSKNYSELSIDQAQSLNNPLYTITGNLNSAINSSNSSFISVSPDFLMTALKLSEDKKHLIFRGYQSSGKSHHVQLKSFRNGQWIVSKANLLEKMEEKLANYE